MDILNESERRFTKKLCDAMIPVMIEAFWEIWLEAKKESQGKNTPRVFQELLRGVKTWNSSISLKNTEAIVKNQPLFPNLLAAVFVIHVKILSAIRTDKKSKKISIKLPANDVFVQRCYEACAKDLYESPYIIVENHTEAERNEDLHKRFHRHICLVIESMPVKGETEGFAAVDLAARNAIGLAHFLRPCALATSRAISTFRISCVTVLRVTTSQDRSPCS